MKVEVEPVLAVPLPCAVVEATVVVFVSGFVAVVTEVAFVVSPSLVLVGVCVGFSVRAGVGASVSGSVSSAALI